MRSLGYALVVAVLVQGAVAVSEEPPAPDAVASNVHRHFGFFLRLDIGPAYTFASESNPGSSANLSAGGLEGGFSIGGALCEDNILAFHTTSAVAFNGISANSSSSSSSLFYLYGFGPEYTHYFMPSNLYLSGSVLLTVASLTNSQGTSGNVSTTVSTSYNTNAGVGLQLEFGKEWWVSDHWGLGIALHYTVSWNQDAGHILGSSTLTTNVFALDFSATYN